MRNLNAAAAILFLAVLTARGAWLEKESRSEPSALPGLNYRHLALEDSETGARVVFDLALFSSKSCRLRLIDNGEGTRSLAEAMEMGKGYAGVNGGYFDPNFAPLGLRVMNGKMTVPLVRSRLLSGVLLSSDKFIQILRVGEFSRNLKPSAAIECGPFLVDGGHLVAGLESTREARRTFAAISNGDATALGLCSDVSLAGLAKILASGLGDFKVRRALNLDGGSSSAFWFKRKDGSVFSISEQKAVRDFVGVVAK